MTKREAARQQASKHLDDFNQLIHIAFAGEKGLPEQELCARRAHNGRQSTGQLQLLFTQAHALLKQGPRPADLQYMAISQRTREFSH